MPVLFDWADACDEGDKASNGWFTVCMRCSFGWAPSMQRTIQPFFLVYARPGRTLGSLGTQVYQSNIKTYPPCP